jgi:hypothetical protein
LKKGSVMKEITLKFIEPFPARGKAFFMPGYLTSIANSGTEYKLRSVIYGGKQER